MKLLLCSDFSGIGYKYLNKFFKNTKNLTCLFVGYAQDDEFELESGSARFFTENGIKLVSLKKRYGFLDKIDMIFVRGGNTTRLLHYLHEYNQFDKIKDLVEKQDVLYIGSSAGAVLAGSDTEWTLEAEPYEPNIKQLFGENALKGFGWVDKLVFVHCSRHRLCWGEERDVNGGELFRTTDRECYPAYLKDVRKYPKEAYIKLKNNEVYIENGNYKKFIKYNWKHLKFIDKPLEK